MTKVFTENDTVIEVHPQESFAVELRANPTTGYVWEPRVAAPSVSLLDQSTKVRGQGLGAGGTQVFAFKALQPGSGRIVFELLRPWEGKPIDKRIYEVRVVD